MTGVTKSKMQTSKAKAAIHGYGVVELITAGLMGLVLIALVLATLIAPSRAHAQPTISTNVQVMTTDIPQNFYARLDDAGLSLMAFERLVNMGVEVIEVKDVSSHPGTDTLVRLEAAFPEIAFERIDDLEFEPMSGAR